MSTTYKLTYFPVEAKGELTRFIFAQAGVEYEDVRIKKDEWSALKPTTPFGYLPTLEVNGEVLGGSGPIARFVAEKHGLAGSNAIENVKLAGIKDVLDEVVLKMLKAYFENDRAMKKQLSDEVVEKHIPKYLDLMETIIKNNSTDGIWLFGSTVTYVDLNLYLVVDFMRFFTENNLLDNYPRVEKLTNAVRALPNIAKWIENRPERTYGPPIA